MPASQMELETYRVFSAEQDFKYASETFLQVQARRWLARTLQQPLPDFPLALLLENGFILAQIAEIVLGQMRGEILAPERLTVEMLSERKHSAILNDLDRFHEACKALGFRQDDLLATSDVIAGKDIAATCSALWSMASACVARSYQGVPEFVTRTEKMHLRMNAMSRSRSAEKAQKLGNTVVNKQESAAGASRFSTPIISTDCLPITKPRGGLLSTLGLNDADSAYELSADEGSPHSPTLSSDSAFTAVPDCDIASPELFSMATSVPLQAGGLIKPASAGNSRKACAAVTVRAPLPLVRPGSAPAGAAPRPGSGLPKDARRPGSAGPTAGSLRLKLPLPAEITHQAWAVDSCQYKGLPLRPQPVLYVKPLQTEIELVKQPKKRAQIDAALRRCMDVLPALAGAAAAVAAAIVAGRSGRSAQTEIAEVTSQETKAAALAPSREDQLWTVGRA
ncbi:hypothetical protein CVIRNUC_006405 [Coccomyxa viridis]|uniref:Calponin-homology (CH) domain-containing protein n=1 Tax=Coccomyxa viridis TaxID=1274662 RepID=A0AAV1I8N4_9CHLO|nr:hypothetical protein CVIRNUC_006405 [Coccomyxa viridis]